ncbi:hypothetical protein FACS1894217_00990 [Clostridia bacterium]|nr:hypothetical protein FACS1894217_00990 [Clostridia bacterium]
MKKLGSIASIVLFVLAALFLAYGVMQISNTHSYIATQLGEGVSIKEYVETNGATYGYTYSSFLREQIIPVYMSAVAQYVFYAFALCGVGLILLTQSKQDALADTLLDFVAGDDEDEILEPEELLEAAEETEEEKKD